MGSNFAAAVFRLTNVGLVPEPLQSRVGWHWVYYFGKRDPQPKPLFEVRDQIRLKLVSEQRTTRFDTYLHTLKTRYPVHIDANVLAQLSEYIQ